MKDRIRRGSRDVAASIPPARAAQRETEDPDAEPEELGTPELVSLDAGAVLGEGQGGDAEWPGEVIGGDDEVYVPPTDPVVTTDEHAEAEVLGGFSESSMQAVNVARSAEDDRLGDEAIADAVRRELREDAATSALDLLVEVRGGVVSLRGQVAGQEDADSAEEVAGRVPGVEEVVDELEVART